jgi:hypothetical protein
MDFAQDSIDVDGEGRRVTSGAQGQNKETTEPHIDGRASEQEGSADLSVEIDLVETLDQMDQVSIAIEENI